MAPCTWRCLTEVRQVGNEGDVVDNISILGKILEILLQARPDRSGSGFEDSGGKL